MFLFNPSDGDIDQMNATSTSVLPKQGYVRASAFPEHLNAVGLSSSLRRRAYEHSTFGQDQGHWVRRGVALLCHELGLYKSTTQRREVHSPLTLKYS